MSEINVSTREAIVEQLRVVARRPLKLRPDFPAVAARWEAWWHCRNDRPLLICSIRKPADAGSGKGGDIRRTKPFELLDRPDEWLGVTQRQVENTICLADKLPSVRVDLGPVTTAAYLGAPLHISLSEDTTWQSPTIESWSEDSIPRLDHNNRWLRIVLACAEYAAARAAGNYLISLPDFGGAADVLANMRGAENLLMDLYDQPAAIVPAAQRAVEALIEAFWMVYRAIVGNGAGVTNWLGVWSDEPCTVPSCDFNYMISREHFAQFCLPSLVTQARAAGRCIVHVDGIGASKHIPRMLEEPSITAIQYTPGAGTPSALAMLDSLRLVQQAGKPLVLCCPADEVPELVDKLDHRGLVLLPAGVGGLEAAERLVKIVGA